MSYLEPPPSFASPTSSSPSPGAPRDPSSASSASTSWPEVILARLEHRDAISTHHAPWIRQFDLMVRQMTTWKHRTSLLVETQHRAARDRGATTTSTSSNHDDSVRTTLIASLERELSTLRLDLSHQYKLEATNAHRLLSLTDQLRETEDRARRDEDLVRALRTEVDQLRERHKAFRDVVEDKERQLI
ncbi:hypothetical protein JCM10212_003930, partial [Sporobolomyces blumeae]